MKKNGSGQKIGCQMTTASDGSEFTSAVVAYVTGDAGTQAAGSVGAGACTHEGHGYHTYAPAQAETNYDLIAFTFVGTGAISSTVQVETNTGVASNIKKNTALAAFEFLMTDSTNHNPSTGLTVTATRSIDGGAFGAGTLGSVTEVSNGMYKLDLGAGDLNGNVITLRFTAASSDDLFVTIVTEP